MGCLTRALWVVVLAFLVFVAIAAWFVSIVTVSAFSPLVLPWLAVALGATWLAYRLSRSLWRRPLPGAISEAIAQLPAGKKVRRSQGALVNRPTDEEVDSATDYGRASAVLLEYMHDAQGERRFEANRAAFETAGYELAAVARTENRSPGQQAALSVAARILSYGASGEPDIGRIYALYRQRPGPVPARPIPSPGSRLPSCFTAHEGAGRVLLGLRVLIVLVASLNAALSLIVEWQAIALQGDHAFLVFSWVVAAGVPLALAVLAGIFARWWAAFIYAGWSLFSIIWTAIVALIYAEAVNDLAWSVGLSLVGFVVGISVGLLLDRSTQPARKSAAGLEAAHASGVVSDAMYPFEKAKIELARTGKRRLFVCGRCGKGISLGWTRCDHCEATFDEFPPVGTGQVV